ncbi:polysaccharide pyruvyl transferase family protein [Zhihengliuella halotolerans]|nr:polysaccharide pyruvyl transferase family protein [Zhihengliuella halotolerans]
MANIVIQIKAQIKNMAKRVLSSPLYARLLHDGDMLTARLAKRRTKTSPTLDRDFTLVLAPSGHGNLGDQAMFESCLDNISGPKTAILDSADALLIPEGMREETTVVVLPRAISGLPVARIPDVLAFSVLAAKAKNVVLPGADTMDGGGNPSASHARVSLMRLASFMGANTRILGFSWPPRVSPPLAQRLAKTSEFVSVFARDPESHRRLLRDGVRASLVSDIVFTSVNVSKPPVDIVEYVHRRSAEGEKFVILNCSGLIARRKDLREEYKKIVRYLQNVDYRVVFLPHVIRDWDDDLSVCREIYNEVGSQDDLLVSERLVPSQVRWLTSAAHLTVTGRMHLAIQSFSKGTPAITLATSGKVEGLYELLGLEIGCVSPDASVAHEVAATMEVWTSEASNLEATLRDSVATAQSMSKLNFAGLG